MLLSAHTFPFFFFFVGVNLLFLKGVRLTVPQDTPTCPAIFLNPDLMKPPPGEESQSLSIPSWYLASSPKAVHKPSKQDHFSRYLVWFRCLLGGNG